MENSNENEPLPEGKDLVEEVLLAVNMARGELGIPAVIDPLIDNLTDVYKSTIVLQDVMVESKTDDEAVVEAISKLNEVLALNDSDSELSWVRNTLLNRTITHLDARIGTVDDENVLVLDVYYKYIDVEPIGSIIDGDLVIQGSCLNPNYGPVLCIIEYTMEDSDKFSKALGIPPWNMIYTPANKDESVATFSIPISLGLDYKRGSLRASIYVDEITKISYKEEKKDFKISAELYICAWECTAKEDEGVITSSNEILGAIPEEEDITNTNFNEDDQPSITSGSGNNRSSNKENNNSNNLFDMLNVPDVITDIRIARDYDDVQALNAEGYDLNCIQLTPEGIQHSQEYLWKFYVMVAYQPYSEELVGIEDVKWYRCVRTKNNEVHSIPGYDLLIGHDLADKTSEYAVYLAVKTGTKPRIRSLAMISTSLDDDSQLHDYIDHQRGKFQQAPAEIGRSMGNHSVGLLLEYISEKSLRRLRRQSSPESEDIKSPISINNGSSNSNNRKRGSVKSMSQSLHSGDSVKDLDMIDGDGSMSIDDDNEDENNDESNILGLGETNLENEDDDDDNDDDNNNEQDGDDGDDKDSSHGYNTRDAIREKENIAFLQQRYDVAVVDYDKLMNENLELQKKAALYIAKEKLKQSQAQISLSKSAIELAQQTFQESEGMKDMMIEKQKQFENTMKSIQEIKGKLIRQEDDFSQLAMDLQTRLDDKEFKAMEIANSFMNFKREILSKAVYSRTGTGISKRMIKSFELAEIKRDEELEKVRLRNISLRTTLKKLERTLRAKEQLAEGLHMIDFEQLKIENQSLNEKIEERNEEIAKLKRKKTFTVQLNVDILTHIREKLRFYRNSNGVIADELADVDNQIMNIRSNVNENKHIRDDMRIENKDLKLKQGFATNSMLVQDFESRKYTVEHMKLAIKDCQEQYSILLDQISLEQDRPSIRTSSTPVFNGGGIRLGTGSRTLSSGMQRGRSQGNNPGTIKSGLSLSTRRVVTKEKGFDGTI